jgi:hypothetical protein
MSDPRTILKDRPPAEFCRYDTGNSVGNPCVSEGGLEPGNAGNFPNSGKFPWVQHNGRCPQAPGISRSSRFLGRAAGDVRGGPLRGHSDPARRSRSVLSAESGQAKYPPFGAAGMSVARAVLPAQIWPFCSIMSGVPGLATDQGQTVHAAFWLCSLYRHLSTRYCIHIQREPQLGH